MTFLFAKLLGLFPLTWPESLRKAAAWVSIAIAVIGLLWAARAAYDASVIDDHEKDRAIESIEARDDAADARASDAVANTKSEEERADAIDNAPKGGQLSPAALALSCQRLRQRGGKLPAACGSDRSD